MAEEQVVYDDVGPNLTRNMLIMRVGAPVDCESWWAKLTPEAQLRSSLLEFELGERVKRHHLRIQWKPRELIGFAPKDRRLKIPGWKPRFRVNDGKAIAAVIWWLDQGESISGGLRSAAELYWASTGVWPAVGLMWKEPPAPQLPLAASPHLVEHEMGGESLSVRMVKWVPVGCVVVL